MSNEEKLLELSRSITGLNRTCSNELLKGEGIHFGQPPIFHALLKKDEQSQCDIAAAIGVSRASVGVSLRRMEKGGIVKRVINQKDSRYNLVSLTEKGRALAQRSEDIMLGMTEAKIKGFTPEEVDTLVDLLSRLEANMKALQHGKTPAPVEDEEE